MLNSPYLPHVKSAPIFSMLNRPCLLHVNSPRLPHAKFPLFPACYFFPIFQGNSCPTIGKSSYCCNSCKIFKITISFNLYITRSWARHVDNAMTMCFCLQIFFPCCTVSRKHVRLVERCHDFLPLIVATGSFRSWLLFFRRLRATFRYMVT